jgi:uncharacterized protein involved in outer membrane biogenesis
VDVAPDADLELAASADVHLDPTVLAIRDIQVSVGSSDLGGAMTWYRDQVPDTLSLEFSSSLIDLDEILSILPTASGTPKEKAPASEWAGLPPIDLDLSFASIRGGALDLQNLEASGHLRAGLVDNAEVSVLVEDELALRGELDLDLRQQPNTGVFNASAGNVDLGRLLRKLEVTDDLVMRADGVGFRWSSEGVGALDMLGNSAIGLDLSGFAWDVQRPGHEGAPAEPWRVRLSELGVSANRGEKLIARSRGQIEGTAVELLVEAPELADLVGDVPVLPLRVAIRRGSNVIVLDSVVNQWTDAVIGGSFELSGRSLPAPELDLASLEAPLPDYAVTGELVYDESGLVVSKLAATRGTSQVAGELSWLGDARPKLSVELTSELLQTEDLLYFSDRDAEVTESPETDTVPAASTSTARGPLLIATDLVKQYQQENDLDLRIAVEELRAGSNRLGGADLQLTITEDEFRLDPLSIRLPGGGLEVQYGLRTQDGRAIAELKADIDNLIYGDVIRMVDPSSEARGILYLNVDFESDAPWADGQSGFETLLRNANGSIEVAAWPENLEAGVLDLWTANLVLALLPTSTTGDPSRLNCVVARLEADDGVLKAKTALLDSTETIVRGRGTIDLAAGQLDLLVTPQAKLEKFLSASTPVKVTGPLRDFEVGVEPTGVFGTVLKWYTSLIYVPFKWLTGERFPADGVTTCFDAMDWELTPAVETYLRERDFSRPPTID